MMPSPGSGGGATPPIEAPPEDTIDDNFECENTKYQAKTHLSRCRAMVAENTAFVNQFCTTSDTSFLESITVEFSFGSRRWGGSVEGGIDPNLAGNECRRQLDLNAEAADRWCQVEHDIIVEEACTR